MTQTRLREVLERLQKKVADVRALIVLGPDGVLDHVESNPETHIDTIVLEYGTLLRIAGRASEDTGAGHLIEHVLVSEKCVMIARTISPDHFLILLSGSQDQLGRARYELKQAVWELQKFGV